MGNIFFTSDLHLNHNKTFCYEPRGFNNVEEMNETLIQNWNEMVRPSDLIYVLGDFMMGRTDESIEYIKRLNGNIMLIIGNHDTDARIKAYTELPNIQVLGYAQMVKFGKYSFFISHYPTLVSFYDTESQKASKRWNLCGHSHTQNRFADMDKGCIYHVEVDAHSNKPVCLEEIKQDIQKFEFS